MAVLIGNVYSREKVWCLHFEENVWQVIEYERQTSKSKGAFKEERIRDFGLNPNVEIENLFSEEKEMKYANQKVTVSAFPNRFVFTGFIVLQLQISYESVDDGVLHCHLVFTF